MLVQVTKDPVGHKGARLTNQVSLPGRYLVYVPGASMTGISRKLPVTERTRLKQILKKVTPENGGVIVRTAAEGTGEEELARDVARLAAQWENIERKAASASPPELLYSEPDLTIRVVSDIFNEDFSELVVAGDDGWDTVNEYVRYVAPHLAQRLRRWEGDADVFASYRIDEQLAKALERKVWLPSGGSLVIDRTEAMTVIDVNTGKFTGQGGNLEETVTRNNLEAAEEIVRQLRLRDIGGIIVIDFIDMVLESNRELVLRRMLECLARDRTKHQVAEVTSLGLVQMTRKRVGSGLLEAFSEPCECCNGRGLHVSLDLLDAAVGKRPRPAGAAAEATPEARPMPRARATRGARATPGGRATLRGQGGAQGRARGSGGDNGRRRGAGPAIAGDDTGDGGTGSDGGARARDDSGARGDRGAADTDGGQHAGDDSGARRDAGARSDGGVRGDGGAGDDSGTRGDSGDADADGGAGTGAGAAPEGAGGSTAPAEGRPSGRRRRRRPSTSGDDGTPAAAAVTPPGAEAAVAPAGGIGPALGVAAGSPSDPQSAPPPQTLPAPAAASPAAPACAVGGCTRGAVFGCAVCGSAWGAVCGRFLRGRAAGGAVPGRVGCRGAVLGAVSGAPSAEEPPGAPSLVPPETPPAAVSPGTPPAAVLSPPAAPTT